MARELLNQVLTSKDSYFDFDNLRFPKHSPIHLRKFDLGRKTYSVIDSISRNRINKHSYREVCRVTDGMETGYIAIECHPRYNDDSIDLSCPSNWEVVLISDIETERIEALKIAKKAPIKSLEEELTAV